MATKILKKEFNVGDTVVIENWATTLSVDVTRLTKTTAVCRTENGYEYKFKKEYEACEREDGSMFYYVYPVPRIRWNTNRYSVIAKGGDNEKN